MKKLNTRWLLSVIFLIFATAAALFAVYFLLPGTSDSSDSENQNTHVVSSDFIRTTGFYFDTVVTITIMILKMNLYLINVWNFAVHTNLCSAVLFPPAKFTD